MCLAPLTWSEALAHESAGLMPVPWRTESARIDSSDCASFTFSSNLRFWAQVGPENGILTFLGLSVPTRMPWPPGTKLPRSVRDSRKASPRAGRPSSNATMPLIRPASGSSARTSMPIRRQSTALAPIRAAFRRPDRSRRRNRFGSGPGRSKTEAPANYSCGPCSGIRI